MSSASIRELPPLPFAQQKVLFQRQSGCEVPIYNQVLVLRRRGLVDSRALEQTFGEITRRHSILRTTPAPLNGNPTPVTCDDHGPELTLTDLSGLPEQQCEAEVSRIVRDEALCPFDFAEGRFIRARLLRLSHQEHLVVTSLPAALADEWSLNVLAHEVDTLYQSYSGGSPSSVGDLSPDYAEYPPWRTSRLQRDIHERDISFWGERLADIPPVLALGTDKPRSEAQDFQRSRHSLVFSKNLSASVEALSEKEGVCVFTTMLAAFEVLLSRYTGQSDIVLGSIISGRDRIQTRNLIGRVAQTIVIRNDLGPNPSFRELQRQVADELQHDRKHQNLPIDSLLNDPQSNHSSTNSQIFRVMFYLAPTVPRLSGWEPVTFELAMGAAQLDLQVQLHDRAEEVVVNFIYNSDLFESATIARLAGNFETLLKEIVANPDKPVLKIPLLTPAERHQLLTDWNDTRMDYPKERCLHQLFEEQVSRTPDAIAIEFESQQLTYHQLNRRANQLARDLLKLGVTPGALVGICAERCPDMIAGLLAILKAGGAYVPLDPQYPSERLSFMLQDSGLKVLVTQTSLRPKFREYNGEVAYLDSPKVFEDNLENCSGGAKPEDLAYVIYTSGSTGKPKGVQIIHRSLMNFLVSMASRPGLTADDSLLAVTTISFDIAALELYLPLIVGGRVILASRETAADGYKLQEILATKAPTVMQATPATWRLLLEAGWQGAGNLKILCGGEAMTRDLAVELLKRARSLWNMYGPTETTVWSTTSQITSGEGPITIGRPIGNTDVYVLDNDLEPVPVGVPGELYIGGAGVALGYLHRAELTAEKFIPHPFDEQEPGARLYRTGDLARYRNNGEIECLGRTDTQVKVRGFRIELGEIESLLNEHPRVKQNAVVAREDAPGDKRIVGYVVLRQTESVGADELREFLKQKLPDYMLPSQFVFLESLPLTPNGKVDRKVLPKPEHLGVGPRKEYTAAPKDSIESQLVNIWESVLHVRNIGTKENFFDLGGHSLLVAKLLRRIEQVFGKKLSMASIFEAPTVEQQAAMLRKGSAPRCPAVISVQPAGSKPPFFCFGFGVGPLFRPLAERLGHDQPLLAVDPTLLEPSQLPPSCDMEQITACLAKQILELYPDGPYYLGGLCGGGLVAYATARHLIAQGHQVALLALIEPHPSYYDYYVAQPNGSGSGWFSTRLKFHIGNLRHIAQIGEARAYIWEHIRERSRVHFRSLKRLFRDTFHEVLPSLKNQRLRGIRDVVDDAYRAYRLQPFSGQVVLFQATHREPGGDWEREYWKQFAPEIIVHEIPGYSNWVVRFFLEPDVEILANKLSAHFEDGRIITR